jgi:hypothetical protein
MPCSSSNLSATGRWLVSALLVVLPTLSAFCQSEEVEITFVDALGRTRHAILLEGDTIPVEVDLDTVYRSDKRHFVSPDERRRYLQIRYNALKVYPYAVEAIRVYREERAQTEDMRKGKKKKYTRDREKDLRGIYEKDLKKLTKLQGYILIKMIERELRTPFYDVIGELRGGWQAFKWQQLARIYGFNLKKGYEPKQDPLLEMILSDLRLKF